jgi:hypothetical protein
LGGRFLGQFDKLPAGLCRLVFAGGDLCEVIANERVDRGAFFRGIAADFI